MAVGYITEQNLQISRGLIRGAYSVNKFGYNTSIGSSAFETVWDGSNLYTYIETAGTAAVTSSNTAADNVGTVTVTVDSKSAAIISPARGQTLMTLYTIPAGKKGYLVQLDIGNSKDLELEVALVFRNGASNVWQTKDFITKRGGFTEKEYKLPIEIPEKYDKEVRAKASATAAVSPGFELIVLDVPRTMQV